MTIPDEVVTIRCTANEHRVLHKYAKTVGRTKNKGGLGSLIWGLPLRTLLARAIRFDRKRFPTTDAYAAAVRVEQAWVARTSV